MSIFLAAVPLNFYSVLSVLLVLVLCLRDWDFGPMRAAERRARVEGKVLRDGAAPVVDEQVIAIPPKPGAPPRALNMLAPLAVLLGATPLGIAVTGVNGARAAGIAHPGLMECLNHASGATAVLWGVLAALAVCMALLSAQRILAWGEIMDLFWRGAGGLVSLAALMVFAFAIGATCTKLGTGQWVASTAEPLVRPGLIAPIVFVVSCLIAFATGTSWGTFAIMMPLAAPLAAAFIKNGAPVSLPLVVSAVLGGGVFGDHCSPISDTTIVSSMAACSDHIDHVRTQMPYALAAAGGALGLYLLLGVS
jgi:Na+/H+ antiporter NhaC